MYLYKNLFVVLLTLWITSCFAQSVYIKKSDIIENRNGQNYYIHTVEKGQTVYSIAKTYDVGVDEIYFDNPGAKTGISIGQQLLIPTVNKETKLNTEVRQTNYEFFYHIAAANETFHHISTIYVIPENYIRKANPTLSDPLREGEYVKVPVEGAFNALDGNTIADNVKSIPESYRPITPATKPQPKPAVKPIVEETTNQKPPVAKPAETKENKPATPKPVIESKKNSEFISFDPNLAVLADYRHVVIAGETTESIAKKYDIPTDLLKAANPGLGNSVMKGERLRVPDKSKIEQGKPAEPDKVQEAVQEVTPQPSTQPTEVQQQKPDNEPIKHLVKKKETLYSIGREYGVTVDEILQANPGLTPAIKIGQTIYVPKKKITKPFLTYRAESKIKTKIVARNYLLSTDELYELNPGLGKWVYPGQLVRIPVGSKAIVVDKAEPEPDVVSTPEVDVIEIDEVHALCSKNNPQTYRSFRVALMLPLYLEEIDSLNKTEFLQQQQSAFLPFRFIGFYEGALLAVDSLRKLGMQIDLKVYDVDNKLTKAALALADPDLKNADLIIGPFYPECYQQIANFAGIFNIPIVNPLTFRDDAITSLPSSFKVKPGKEFQYGMVVNYIKQFHANANVFFITQNAYEDADIVQNLLNELRMATPETVTVSNNDLYNLAVSVAYRDEAYSSEMPLPHFSFEGIDIFPELLQQSPYDSTTIQNLVTKIVYMNDSLHPFVNRASALRPNVVVVYGETKSFVMDVMNRLNEIRDTFNIQLIGMPAWERISNISNTQLSNLRTITFSSDYLNYNAPETQKFVHDFRTSYSTEPDQYAFLGYDITYYFLYNLFLFDKNFQHCIDKNPMIMLQSGFHFKRKHSHTFENTYWNMLKYNNLELRKIPDSLIISPTTVK